MKVVVSDTEIYLAEIQIDKHHQKQGLGTKILKSIIQQAETNNQTIYLKVIQGNPAERLYTRLGFTILAESATHKKMIKKLSS